MNKKHILILSALMISMQVSAIGGQGISTTNNKASDASQASAQLKLNKSLLDAVGRTDIKTATTLLDQGAKPRGRSSINANDANTPLKYAKIIGNADMIKLVQSYVK
jgi:hypothetical protein